MKIDEIYNLEEEWDKIDQQFNRENHMFRQDETARYEEIAGLSKGETPVIAAEPEVEEKWTSDPLVPDAEIQSPGYRARESVKKRSGVPHKKYNKAADQNHPISTDVF